MVFSGSLITAVSDDGRCQAGRAIHTSGLQHGRPIMCRTSGIVIRSTGAAAQEIREPSGKFIAGWVLFADSPHTNCLVCIFVLQLSQECMAKLRSFLV